MIVAGAVAKAQDTLKESRWVEKIAALMVILPPFP